MIRKLGSLILISFGLLISCKESNEKILNNSLTKMNSIESIEYQVILKIKQMEYGLDETDTANCYFDFTSNDSLTGARFQLIYHGGEDVFDGIRLIMVDKKAERIVYTNDPKVNQVNSSFFVSNSILIVKKLVAELLVDKTANIIRQKDTLINNKNNYCFYISIQDKKKYNHIGVLPTRCDGKSIDYKLCISKKSCLPTQFVYVQKNGFWSSSFSNLNISATRPDSIWGYERFPRDYLRMSNKQFVESMRVKAFVRIGQPAPQWSLPLVSGGSVRLSDLKGYLILMEFWFPNCGGCIMAIPDINSIQSTYQNRNLKVYGIEFTSTDLQRLNDYISKQKIGYPTLYKAGNVAKDYGINAAPTFILIDKKGTIVYSSIGFNKDELINAINKLI